MKCPYCGKKTEIPSRAKLNLESYGDPVNVRVACCGKIVRVYIFYSYAAEETEQKERDDWGD